MTITTGYSFPEKTIQDLRPGWEGGGVARLLFVPKQRFSGRGWVLARLPGYIPPRPGYFFTLAGYFLVPAGYIQVTFMVTSKRQAASDCERHRPEGCA